MGRQTDVSLTRRAARRGHTGRQGARRLQEPKRVDQRCLTGQIEDTHIITPLDYERDYGLQEGSWNHGQMALDQLLMMRPVASR